MQPVAPWPICAECGEDYHPRRHELGFRTCLECGEQAARAQAKARAKACVVTHKSNIVYLGSGQSALALLADISRMRR